MGEGAGVLVLEDEELARERGAERARRGARLRRDLRRAPPDRARPDRRLGRACDHARARRRAAHPGRARLRQRARHLDAAQRSLGDDGAEARARRARHTRFRCPRRSRRSGICSAPPGAVEAIATVLALHERIAPPTLGYDERTRAWTSTTSPTVPRPLPPPERHGPPATAISNSFGFGGHNAVLCLGGAR